MFFIGAERQKILFCFFFRKIYQIYKSLTAIHSSYKNNNGKKNLQQFQTQTEQLSGLAKSEEKNRKDAERKRKISWTIQSTSSVAQKVLFEHKCWHGVLIMKKCAYNKYMKCSADLSCGLIRKKKIKYVGSIISTLWLWLWLGWSTCPEFSPSVHFYIIFRALTAQSSCQPVLLYCS